MAKTLAIIFGIIVILVGIAGFVANPLVGAGAVFATNTATNALYIVLGLVLLVVAFAAGMQSGLWLKIVGVVYLLAAVLGFLMVPNGGEILGMFMVNMATNLLHLVLGVVLLIAGFMGKGSMKAAAPAPMPASSMPSNPPMGGSM